MKLSEKWLREWVNPPFDTPTLIDKLTMRGLEVDSVSPAVSSFSQVVIGYVTDVQKHPDADRLNVCQVDVGQKNPLQIVCGGTNVRPGLKVPVALVGAVLPGEFAIKLSKIRGVESQGMICSSKELGLEECVPGTIMELLPDAPVGKDFRAYLKADDHVIEIELTPNRGDCLSIRGLAREVAAFSNKKIKPFSIKPVKHSIKTLLSITTLAPEACPRYCGRVLEGINRDAITPLWMRERLRRSGQRSIHPVVDVCNYVMLELGQPMHAFNVDALQGGITVRHARAHETLTLLDQQEITLSPKALVIADRQGPQALAGIMGGWDSSVKGDTSNIFLESAYFDPLAIQKTARHYSLQTDASYRFERGVDFELPRLALERATRLLLDIVGGKAGPVKEVLRKKELPKRPDVLLRYQDIRRLVGIDVPASTVRSLLTPLGMRVNARTKHSCRITPPSFRSDITQSADVVEEITRAYGYEKIPAHTPKQPLSMLALPEKINSPKAIQQGLSALGYQEIMSYSFIGESWQQAFEPGVTPLALKNPMSIDMAVMRTSLLPGLVKTADYNHKRQAERVQLFEIGYCFRALEETFKPLLKVGGIVVGAPYPLQWAAADRAVDFYDVKGHWERLLDSMGLKGRYEWQPSTHPAFHPGISADMVVEGQLLGTLGQLHPKLLKELDIKAIPIAFEVFYEIIRERSLPCYAPISKFPAIQRDLALIVDQTMKAETLVAAIQSHAGVALQEVKIFDIYQGPGIETGKKSMALRLSFQDQSRTLVDEEIHAIISALVTILEKQFNAKLRV